MSRKVTNFSDLIQRVTASCLLNPLGSGPTSLDMMMTPDRTPNRNVVTTTLSNQLRSKLSTDFDEDFAHVTETPLLSSPHSLESGEVYEDAREEPMQSKRYTTTTNTNAGPTPGLVWAQQRDEDEVDTIMSQIFETVLIMKRAYGKLQAAHNPFDPEKIRVADEAVVAELRHLGLLRERYKKGRGKKSGCGGSRGSCGGGVAVVETVKEVVAPYEAVVEELKKVVKEKEVEVDELKYKISVLSSNNGNKINGRGVGRKKGGSFIQHQASPTPDMFEATMKQVRDSSKSFTSHLLALMRSAHWDLSAAVRSIEASITTTVSNSITTTNSHQHQTKYALESYTLRKIFQGFDHETFYMDGTLHSLLNPSQFRNDCFSKFRDMKSMDPSELLGLLPSSPFGVFCSKKYQDIVHPKMEESLFGNLDQRNQLLSGSHPRTQFYTEFLGLAKAVWLLHMLAFSLDPPPSHFEASRGAEFHPDYMDSVMRYPGGKVPSGHIVGFPVSPGFKLGNGSVVKARVFLVPRK